LVIQPFSWYWKIRPGVQQLFWHCFSMQDDVWWQLMSISENV
jgi:hypothetical protein